MRVRTAYFQGEGKNEHRNFGVGPKCESWTCWQHRNWPKTANSVKPEPVGLYRERVGGGQRPEVSSGESSFLLRRESPPVLGVWRQFCYL